MYKGCTFGVLFFATKTGGGPTSVSSSSLLLLKHIAASSCGPPGSCGHAVSNILRWSSAELNTNSSNIMRESVPHTWHTTPPLRREKCAWSLKASHSEQQKAPSVSGETAGEVWEEEGCEMDGL
jgi:hypothetical protein